MAIPKKFLFRANGPFRTQNRTYSQLMIRCKDYFKTLHYERGQERHGNCINGFSEKKTYLGQFGHIGPKMVRPHHFGSTLSFFFNFPQNKGPRGT